MTHMNAGTGTLKRLGYATVLVAIAFVSIYGYGRYQNYQADLYTKMHYQDIAKARAARMEAEITALTASLEGDPVRIGEKTYSYAEIVEDFLNIAIPKYLWLEDADEYTRREVEEGRKEHYQPDNPSSFISRLPESITEHFLRSNGSPQDHVINKWGNEITIGLGYTVFIDQILKVKADLEKLTGIPVRFMKPYEEMENPFIGKPSARLLVIPIWRETTYRNISQGHRGLVNTMGPYFQSGIGFTPFETFQINGYLLPKADNAIDYSVCRISPRRYNEALTRAFVTECLARALGLPELSKTNNKAALGYWNEETGRKDKEIFDNRNKIEREIRAKGGWDAVVEYQKKHGKYEYPHHLVKTNGLENGFLPYDRFMIALLYCDDIKSGMNMHDVIYVLKESDRCVRQAKEKARR